MSRITLALGLLVTAGAVAYFALQGSEEGAAQPARVGSLNITTSGTRVAVEASVVAAASPLVSVRFDWGDGTSDDLPIDGIASTWTVRAEHDYAASGPHEVTLVATFADGSNAESSRVASPGTGAPAVAPSTPIPTSTASATATSSPAATETPTAAPTTAPTTAPTPPPTPSPTPPPTATPSPEPTAAPTPTGPNQPPTVRIVQLSGAALSATLIAVFDDPEDALVGAGIDWGDGAVEEVVGGSITRTHSYAAPGTYAVTIFALDAQGLEAAVSDVVTVTEG